MWRLARRLEQRAPGARRGEARPRGQPAVAQVRAVGRVLVFGNLSMVTSTNGNGGVVDVSSKGLVTECRPISGCCRFLFFRLIFSSCLKLLRADFQGPRNGRWQVLWFLSLTTNLREINEFETKLRQVL